VLVFSNPLPFTASVWTAAPAGTDVGEIEVTARGSVAGGCGVPPFEPTGFELPQPTVALAIARHTTAEEKMRKEQDFMVESKYIHNPLSSPLYHRSRGAELSLR
jgi:hypothetical protein